MSLRTCGQCSDVWQVPVQVAVSIQRGSKANDQKQAKFAKGSGQTTKQVAAVVKPMSGRKAATALPSAAQQKAVRTASPLAESDAKETLPVKARVIKGKEASWAPATCLQQSLICPTAFRAPGCQVTKTQPVKTLF